uniref:Uncharacterized mitochondrial protein AtMg00810-like n=1 Tax=Tanacetum cinerariifolium TaxID=118510 RepID=A0A6L2J758_TANCI|nr:uncharacterized mitochondrial protein AtMg00810-like [Tanacetum cinerariifolium]
MDLQDKVVIDSECSRHMTGNMFYLTNYKEIDGGYVAFEGNPKGRKITGKSTIKTGNLDFENVYFMRELKLNHFSVSQMCDKKNNVLISDTECIVLSPNFKLIDESQVLLRVPRKNNMYSVDLKNIVPKGGLTCLFAKATSDESKLWHRRLGHLHFKTMNKLVKGNLVRGTKDETSGILKSFITRIENIVDHKVKMIRCDNRTEFKNRDMNQFYEIKGILRQFSVARTPQQNRVDERRNKTLIKAARTMLADFKLPTTFWAEVVNTACYVQNRVLVVKPHNKTPYKFFHGRTPTLSFMRPFGCHVIILNTKDHLGKFNGKADEGFFVGNSLNSKTFKVFNSRIKIVEENLRIRFCESTPNVVGTGPDWLFDIDALTRTLNCESIVAVMMERRLMKIQKKENECNDQEKEDNVNSTNNVNAVSSTVNAAGTNEDNELPFDPNMHALEDVGTFDFSIEDEDDDIMDVKSAFLYGKIEEEVYACQPPGFEDPYFLDRVYKVEKALYGGHHAPKVWYKTLSTYMLDNGCQREKIDKTLFIKRHKGDILLMSSMGELTFFLGLQVKQKNDGIFISQDKYVDEILKKFRFTKVKNGSTPMETQKPLLKDEDIEEVDVHMYRSMLGSLMYLTSSRPDIMFAVYACTRYQVNPKVLHLHAVKKIFRYLKGQPKLGLWYPKDSLFDLIVYNDSDYVGASLDRKSTTGGGKDRPPMLAHEGSPETQVKGYMETCKNVSQDIRDQLDVEAKTVQIILTGIDNDIYTTVDACPNTCEMWKAIERQQAVNKNKRKAIVNSPPPTYDQEPDKVSKDNALSKEKNIDKLMALISLSLEKIYKHNNNNLRTSSNTSREHQDKTLRINRGTRYDNQRVINAAEARENESTQELEAHYMYMEKIQEVSPDAEDSGPIFDAEDSGPIFDAEPLDKTNEFMYKDLKKFQDELEKRRDVNYMSKVEFDCAKAKCDLMSYKMESQKVKHCKQTIEKRTYFRNRDPFIKHTIEGNFSPQIQRINADLEQVYLCLKEEMIDDLRYFNSLEHEVDYLKSQLENQKTQFLNKIDRLSREYYYVDHMNAILGVYTKLDESSEKCQSLENELSKRNATSQNFEPIVVPISSKEPKRTMNQSVATPIKRTVASESTNRRPISKIRKQYEQISKTCKWWYSKITPPGYTWKHKNSTVNVKQNVSMPLACRDNSIHFRLWVLKANDEKSQAPKYLESLLITHQGNSLVKDNKIDLLVQQYEQFNILEKESIGSGFARFDIIITSLNALDEGFSIKNYVRKFLRALHPKWRSKVIVTEESKDLSSLALDELIDNLKVHEVVMEKDSKIYRGKKERVKSMALKAKKESSDDETLTSRRNDEEYAMAVRNFKRFFRRNGKFLGNQKKKRRHSDKGMRRKERVIRNVLDAVIQIISLVIVQSHLATKIKRPSLEVLGVIVKMTPKTKLMTKLVSWLNHQIC